MQPTLRAYIDDSASDKGERRLFLAGYIATPRVWDLFSVAWAEQLRDAPSIAYLNMSEANSLSGQFAGWSVATKDEKIRQLARVIRHFKPTSIHTSISRTDVDSILKPVAPYGFATPYFYCFQAIMLPLAIQLAKEAKGGTIQFIFDNQEDQGEEASRIFQMIRDTQPEGVKSLLAPPPMFADDKLTMPLQAADMLAWHIRRHHEPDKSEGWFVPEILTYGDDYHIACDFDRVRLEKIAIGLAQIPGVPALQKRRTWRNVMKEVHRLRAAGFIYSGLPHKQNVFGRFRAFVFSLFR